jgi:hypothetical protein
VALTWMGELPTNAVVDMSQIVGNISRGVTDSSKFDAYQDDDLEAVVQRFKFMVEAHGASERQAAEVVPLFLKGRALRAFNDEFREPRKATGGTYSAKEAWDFLKTKFQGAEFLSRAKTEFENIRWSWGQEGYDEVERKVRLYADRARIKDEDALIIKLRSVVPFAMQEEMRRMPYPKSVDEQVSAVLTLLHQSAFSKFRLNGLAGSSGSIGPMTSNTGRRFAGPGFNSQGPKLSPLAMEKTKAQGGKNTLAMVDPGSGGESDFEEGTAAPESELALVAQELDGQSAHDLLLFMQERKPGTCWNCGQIGHRYADCPTRAKEGK